MTLNEAFGWADETSIDRNYPQMKIAAVILAAEVRRLQAECERLPARRAQPTVKTAPIAPPNFAFFGIVETDEEFAARAGRQVTEVAE